VWPPGYEPFPAVFLPVLTALRGRLRVKISRAWTAQARGVRCVVPLAGFFPLPRVALQNRRSGLAATLRPRPDAHIDWQAILESADTAPTIAFRQIEGTASQWPHAVTALRQATSRTS